MVLVIATVVALVGYEVALDAAHRIKRALPFHAPKAVVSTSNAPGQVGAPEPKRPKYGPTEDFPFRSLIPESDPVGLRFWTASASHGEAAGHSPDRIFPNLVCANLNELDIPSSCLNQSRGGSPILSNVGFLKEHGEFWRPDYALLYQMSMDVSHFAGKYRSGPPGDDAQDAGPARRPPFSARVNAWLLRKLESTMVWRSGREFIGSVLLLNAPLPDALPPAADMEFERRITAFLDQARAVDAKPILTTFALSYDIESLDSMPFRIRTWSLFWQSGLSLEGFISTFARYNELLRAIAHRERVLLVDLAEEFGGRPEFFEDLVHFNGRGHEQVARVIAEALVASDPELQ